MKLSTSFKEGIIKNLYIVALIFITFIGIKIINNFDFVLKILVSLKNALWPIILGLIIAYVLNPLLKLIESKTKFKRGISLLLTYTLIAIVLAVSVTYILPSIVESLKQLTYSIPDFVSSANDAIEKYIGNDIFKSWLNSTEILKTISSWSTAVFNTLLSSLVSITGSLINWLLAIVVSVYFLFDKERFLAGAKKATLLIFRERIGLAILELVNHIHTMLGAYIGARALISLIICVPAALGLIVLKSEFVVLITVMFGLTNMIPYIGPALGMIIGFTLNMFYSPSIALFVVIWFLIIQQVDANILDPKLSGTKVGISPVTCITALAIGGAFYGIVGMLLAVPIAGVIKLYYVKFIERCEKKNPFIQKYID